MLHYSVPCGRSPEDNNFIEEQVQKFIDEGIIRESDSNITSPVVLVKKKGKIRFCIDFRWFNNHNLISSYPIPHMKRLERLKYFQKSIWKQDIIK